MSTPPDYGEGSWAGFGVIVSYDAERATLAVRGEVDLLTAPELGAIVDLVIDRDHRVVVLDLAELRFMDGSGLGVIAKGAERLRTTGGEFVLRSPSVLLARLLEITGLIDAVRVEVPEVNRRRLGAEQAIGACLAAASEDAGLIAQLRRATAIPADRDVVDGVLGLVVALARAIVSGADGVSVSLLRHGRLATVAASDQTVTDMDNHQYATGEGPCVDASIEGRWFHAESLDTESRWPAFIPKAAELGINAILSTPLMGTEAPVGALNIYSRTTAPFAAAEQELAAIFAAEASVILRDAGVDMTEEAVVGRLDEALATRKVISQAQGIVMARRTLSADDAFDVLRRRSQTTERPLRDVAAEVVISTQSSHPGDHMAESDG